MRRAKHPKPNAPADAIPDPAPGSLSGLLAEVFKHRGTQREAAKHRKNHAAFLEGRGRQLPREIEHYEARRCGWTCHLSDPNFVLWFFHRITEDDRRELVQLSRLCRE